MNSMYVDRQPFSKQSLDANPLATSLQKPNIRWKSVPNPDADMNPSASRDLLTTKKVLSCVIRTLLFFTSTIMPLVKDLAMYPPEVFELSGSPVKAIVLSDQICQSALGSVTTILSGDSEGKAEVDVTVNGLCDTVTLWPHQKTGIAWMRERESGVKRGGIVSDDMGYDI